MIKDAIMDVTYRKDVVLDCFLGSESSPFLKDSQVILMEDLKVL